MVLANAVSSTIDDEIPIRTRVKRAEDFFQRGIGLSRQSEDSGTNLEEVQCLLLGTQYLVSCFIS